MTSNEGPDKNVIIFQPPLCFTCDNARTAVKAFDEALREVEDESTRVTDSSGDITVPISIITSKHKLDSDEDDDFDFSFKRQKIGYEDMD